MERKIIKAKLTDENRLLVSFLEITGDVPEIGSDEVDRKCKNIAHPDLVAAFKGLTIHLASLCEQGAFTEYEDAPEKLDIFDVTSISIGGEGEHEGVTITGMRRLKDNKVLNLNAPFTKLDRNHSHYSYADSLSLAIQNVLSEADQYLNGKYAPSNQLDLFEQLEEAIDSELKEEKPKRRSRKLKTDEAEASMVVNG